MYLSEIFKKQKSVWVFIGDYPPEKAAAKFSALGYKIRANPGPAVCLYPDKTVSYIHGYISGIFFSRGIEAVKKSRPDEIILSLNELTEEKSFVGWKKARIFRL